MPLQTVFPVDDDMRLVEALEIAADAKQVRYLGPGADPGIPERGGGELNTAITFDAKMVSATMPPPPLEFFFEILPSKSPFPAFLMLGKRL